jgi:MFS family permease
MHGQHHSLASISWVIMAHTLGMFGLSFMTGWLVDTWGQLKIIFAGGLLLVAACLLAPVWNNVFWFALALFLLGLGWNFCFVAGSALLAAVLRPSEKGRTQGLTDMMVNIASGIGSVGSGLVFAAMGFWVMSWLSIVIAVTPMLLVLLSSRWGRKTALEGAVSS